MNSQKSDVRSSTSSSSLVSAETTTSVTIENANTNFVDSENGVPPPLYYPPGDDPPTYHVAATLPTYEEAELSKGKRLFKPPFFHFASPFKTTYNLSDTMAKICLELEVTVAILFKKLHLHYIFP